MIRRGFEITRQRSTGQGVFLRLTQIALRLTGKGYTPSPDIPSALIAATIRDRVSWLIRGLVRFRRSVFVAASVRVRGKRQIYLGRYATLESHVVVDGYSQEGVRIGARTKIGAYSVISCTSHLSVMGVGFSIGSDGSLGEFAYVGASGGVQVGDNVIMGQYVTFHSQEHVYADRSRLIRVQGVSQKGIRIGDDCWVGARVTFLDGTDVGDGCVVAAGSVVRGKVPPFSVVAGVPASVVGQRRNGE